MKNPTKYRGNELRYVESVLNSENWSATAGSWNQVLENKLAEKFGVNYAVAFNSGTSTLHAALEACGVQEGDEVISPALTVIMNTTATIHANAIPVYADVDPDTFTIDPEDIRRKITPKTKAIFVVSLSARWAYTPSRSLEKVRTGFLFSSNKNMFPWLQKFEAL